MNVDLTAILVPLGGMATAVLIVYFVNSFRHKERIELLKMGLTPPPRVGYLRGLVALFMGCVSIAAGLALLLTLFFNYDPERVTWAIVGLFVGIGLGNAGPVLFMDIGIPIIVISLLIAHIRMGGMKRVIHKNGR